jgi:hypothetical protein
MKETYPEPYRKDNLDFKVAQIYGYMFARDGKIEGGYGGMDKAVKYYQEIVNLNPSGYDGKYYRRTSLIQLFLYYSVKAENIRKGREYLDRLLEEPFTKNEVTYYRLVETLTAVSPELAKEMMKKIKIIPEAETEEAVTENKTEKNEDIVIDEIETIPAVEIKD